MQTYHARAALCGVLLLASAAGAAPIFVHAGAADPATEGWTVTNLATATGSAVINDLGLDAWKVNDSTPDGALRYSQPVSLLQNTQAIHGGFVLSALIRSISPDAADASESVYLASGGVWEFRVGSAANGDPLLALMNSSGTYDSYTLTGRGGGYHLYELRKPASPGVAEFFVDNVKLANVTPFNPITFSPTPVMAWGSAGTASFGNANYANVSFEIVPEPGAGMLTLSVLLRRGRRKVSAAMN